MVKVIRLMASVLYSVSVLHLVRCQNLTIRAYSIIGSGSRFAMNSNPK